MNKDFFRHEDVEGLHCLHEKMDRETFQWIANVKVQFDSIYPTTITSIYNRITDKGNRIGANAFRIVDSDFYKQGEGKFIELELYYLNWENRDENRYLFQNESIYLFGFLGHHQSIEGYSIQINDQKILLKELRYKQIELTPGDLITIRLGKGIHASTIQVKYEEGMSPKYFRFNVFKGMFRQAMIDEHSWSFGEFLKIVLRKE